MYLHTLLAFVLGTKEGFAIPLSLWVRLWTSINLGHWGFWQGCARSNNTHSSLAPWDHHTSPSVLGTLIFHLPGVAVFLPSIRQLLIPCLVLRRCILLPSSLLYTAFFIPQFPLFILIIINDCFGSYLNYISFTTWPEVSSFRILVIVLFLLLPLSLHDHQTSSPLLTPAQRIVWKNLYTESRGTILTSLHGCLALKCIFSLMPYLAAQIWFYIYAVSIHL